ncbi:MAG: hypothetical protein KBC27_02815 [Rickettsiales bacterium]|nr:hypothetical protein [Rickettsiales bacterium]
MLSNLHREAIRILNIYGVNMYGNNLNINDLDALNDAERDITLIIWTFIYTYINDDMDYGPQLAQRIAGLFLVPDTVTDEMMNVDNLPDFYRFFVYNFMMHGQNADEADVRVIDQVLVPYVYRGDIPYDELLNALNITAVVNHDDIGVHGIGGVHIDNTF